MGLEGLTVMCVLKSVASPVGSGDTALAPHTPPVTRLRLQIIGWQHTRNHRAIAGNRRTATPSLGRAFASARRRCPVTGLDDGWRLLAYCCCLSTLGSGAALRLLGGRHTLASELKVAADVGEHDGHLPLGESEANARA